MIIDGKKISNERLATLKEKIEFVTNDGIELPAPKLVIIRVGNDAASEVYVRQKVKAASEVGISTEVIIMDEDSECEEVEARIEHYNNDPTTNGIILQLPLPDYLKCWESRLIDVIDPIKDVDGLTTIAIAALRSGHPAQCFEPCTAKGIMALLGDAHIEVSGKIALIIGRSNIVGKPVADMLMREGATIICAHSKTPHEILVKFAQTADIIVSAVGKPGLLAPNEINPNAAIIDVGITRVDGEAANGSIKQIKPRLVGDLYPTIGADDCRAITPVPGGVGPMTVCMLMENTWRAYLIQNEL